MEDGEAGSVIEEDAVSRPVVITGKGSTQPQYGEEEKQQMRGND